MNQTSRNVLLIATGGAAGLAVALVAIWNPLEIAAIDQVLGRSQATSATEPHHGIEAASGTESETDISEREILYWRAPMDPTYISDKPGKSPMGMDLIPVYEDEPNAEGIRVSRSFLQNFAVRTTPVVEQPLTQEIRTVGVLGHNQERVYSVNTKFEGWIERARFNTVGEQVTEGDVLFEIYSPQIVTTQQEYISTLQYVETLAQNDAYPDALERARSLLRSTRERLRYWDMTEAQIDSLGQSGRPNRTITLVSPVSGFIVEKMGDSLEGMRLTPGMTVLKLADHSRLWAEAEFYENDLRHLRENQSVAVEVEAFPGRRWTGRILFFDPALNDETRTLKGFIEIDNRDLKLRPNMFVNISMRVGRTKALLVPDQAVIHSGRRAVVIVRMNDRSFEPREVQLGMAGGGMQEVLSGLAPGESVVTSSQFLIDSESNLKAAISQMLGGTDEEQKTPER